MILARIIARPAAFFAFVRPLLAHRAKACDDFLERDDMDEIGIAILTGAGANNVPVYCDGTNWRIG
jgi:hypothetical protein